MPRGQGRITGSAARWVAAAALVLASSARAASGLGEQPPVVNAGEDQVVPLPGIAALDGTVTSDTLVTVRWVVVSGPGPVKFRNATAQDTEITVAVVGTYVLRLNASDGVSAAGDNVTIVVVAPAANLPPTVSAGADQTIAIADTARWTAGSRTTGCRASLSTAWTLVGGPGTVTIPMPVPSARARDSARRAPTSCASTATDGAATVSDDVTITVTKVNVRPRVSAGLDQSVTLPSRDGLSGTATDDGDAVPPGLALSWSVAKGPGAVTFGSPSAVRDSCPLRGRRHLRVATYRLGRDAASTRRRRDRGRAALRRHRADCGLRVRRGCRNDDFRSLGPPRHPDPARRHLGGLGAAQRGHGVRRRERPAGRIGHHASRRLHDDGVDTQSQRDAI